MTTTRTVSPVEVAAVVRGLKPRAIALADGTTEDWQDPRTGEITQREKWFWIPKSKLGLREPGERGRPLDLEQVTRGQHVIATLPAWLAKERGMI